MIFSLSFSSQAVSDVRLVDGQSGYGCVVLHEYMMGMLVVYVLCDGCVIFIIQFTAMNGGTRKPIAVVVMLNVRPSWRLLMTWAPRLP